MGSVGFRETLTQGPDFRNKLATDGSEALYLHGFLLLPPHFMLKLYKGREVSIVLE